MDSFMLFFQWHDIFFTSCPLCWRKDENGMTGLLIFITFEANSSPMFTKTVSVLAIFVILHLPRQRRPVVVSCDRLISFDWQRSYYTCCLCYKQQEVFFSEFSPIVLESNILSRVYYFIFRLCKFICIYFDTRSIIYIIYQPGSFYFHLKIK